MKIKKITKTLILTSLFAVMLASCGTNTVVNEEKLQKVNTSAKRQEIKEGIIEENEEMPNLTINGSIKSETQVDLLGDPMTTKVDASISGLIAGNNVSLELKSNVEISALERTVTSKSNNKINIQDNKVFLSAKTSAVEGNNKKETSIAYSYTLDEKVNELLNLDFSGLFEAADASEELEPLGFYEMGSKYVLSVNQALLDDEVGVSEENEASFSFYLVFNKNYKFEAIELSAIVNVEEVMDSKSYTKTNMSFVAKRTNKKYKSLTTSEIAGYTPLGEDFDISDLFPFI